jgi:hypothetical protein
VTGTVALGKVSSYVNNAHTCYVPAERQRGIGEDTKSIYFSWKVKSRGNYYILLLTGKSNMITSLDRLRGFWEVEAPRFQIS